MKVQTRPLKEWVLKVPRPKVVTPGSGVKDFCCRTSNGRAPFVYTVDTSKLSNEVRKLEPWEYLRVADDCDANVNTQAVLQSVSSSLRVYRAQRIYATKTMSEGRSIWRRILFQMKRRVDDIKTTRKWYNVSLLYLTYKYLKYCIDEINLTHRRCFKYFGFSNADLRKDSGTHCLHPKARYLLQWTLKEELFELDVLNENDYTGIIDPGLSPQRNPLRC